MTKRVLLTLLLTVVLLGPAPLVQAAGRETHDTVTPSISFEASAATASGLTPNGKVIWFAQGTSWDGVVERRIRQFVTTTATSSGTSRLEPGFAIPTSSVWFAVDLATMTYGAASPPGFAVSRVGVAAAHVSHVGNPGKPRLALERKSVVGMVVRPTEGAWLVAGSDLAATGSSTLSVLNGAVAPPGGNAFDDFADTDVTFLVDPNSLDYEVVGLDGVGR